MKERKNRSAKAKDRNGTGVSPGDFSHHRFVRDRCGGWGDFDLILL
jgi:hypothetical protein